MNHLRCSAVARDHGFDPVGSAGDHSGFLLVDWPLPWPADVADIAALAPLVRDLAGTGLRLQGVVPDAGSDGLHRVVLHHRPDGEGFVAYRRVERRVPPGEIVEAARDLVHGLGAGLPTGAEPGRDGRPRPDGGDAAAPRGDLLVCTHGRRDPCCGGQGTPLAAALAADPAIAAAGYRLSRTSHTGGHRFAPTAIVLPEGTMWAFLDRELAGRIVRREGPAGAVLPSYRGCTGIGSPAAQAVERVAFAEVGWDWLDWRRWGDELPDGRVRVAGEAPDGTRRAWVATVHDRPRPVPVCGRPLDEAVKQAPEPVVVAVDHAAP